MNEVWLQETGWIVLTKFLIMLRKKSNTKEYVVYYPIYVLIKEQAKLMYGDRNQNSADLWEIINWVGIGGSLLGDGCFLNCDVVAGYTVFSCYKNLKSCML